MQKSTGPRLEWEAALSFAARQKGVLPVTGPADRLKKVVIDLEAVAGYNAARTERPVWVAGRLDGIETGVWQLVRDAPLETMGVTHEEKEIWIPAPAEVLRIKAVLILGRNATRDYLDFVVLADQMDRDWTARALQGLDSLYVPANQWRVTAAAVIGDWNK